MTDYTHVVGVDPGLVHTGVVSVLFMPEDKAVEVEHEVILGPNAQAVGKAVDLWAHQRTERPQGWIEGYRSRSNLNSDARMIKAVADIRAATRFKVLDNTGVKKVVKQPLMELLGVWQFATPTHHQDLRSAARIAILGMLKDPDQNRLIADIVKAHLAGTPWTITTT